MKSKPCQRRFETIFPTEEVKALPETFWNDLSGRGGENLAGEDLTLKLITFKLEFSNFV